MEQFKEWWEAAEPKERSLAILGATVIVIGVLYWAIWSPLNSQLIDSKKKLEHAESTLSWTQEKSTLLLQSGIGKAKPKRRGNLSAVLNSSARNLGVTFSRVVNKKDKVEVWIAEIEFDLYVQWLTNLHNRFGISVVNADLVKTGRKGYIKVNRLLLGY